MADNDKPSEMPLEMKLELSCNEFRSSYYTKEGGQSRVYTGAAYQLYFRGLDIWGKIRLTKEILQERKKIKRRLKFEGVVPRIEKEEVPYTEKTKEWEIEDMRCCFISDGKLYENSNAFDGNTYRKILKSSSIKNKIMLSDRLIDSVFGPIEKNLEEEYKKVNDFKDINKIVIISPNKHG
jgi:hypothetical protein